MRIFRGEFGLFFWLHAGFIAVAYASPFLFSVWYIIAGATVLFVHQLILGNCFLTLWHFPGRPDADFRSYYLRKLGITHPRPVVVLMDRTAPLFILLAMVLQWRFGFHPLIV
jgi:hypothetical protein